MITSPKKWLGNILLLGVGIPVFASETPLVITNATVIDVSDWGHSTTDIQNAVVVVRGDRIEFVGQMGAVAIPPEATVLDLAGRYLVPGYIDGFGIINNQAYADAYLAMGVTSIISAADSRRGALFREATPTPTVHILESVGDEAGHLAQHLHDLEVLNGQGVDIALLKYQLRPDQAQALIQRAGELGMATIGEFGHTTYEQAVGMGLNAVVHTTRYSLDTAPAPMQKAVADEPFSDKLDSPKWRYYRHLSGLSPDDAVVQEHARHLAAGSAALMPTAALIYLDQPFARNPWSEPVARLIDPADVNRPADFRTGRHAEGGEVQEAYSALGAAEIRLDSTYAAAGAHFLAGSGTDTWGTMPGISLHQEVEMLSRIGLSPREALAAATSNFEAAMPAVFRKTGQVRAGYRADIVVLSADPRVSVANLKMIDEVILGGERFDRKYLMARHLPKPDGLLLSARPMAWPETVIDPDGKSLKPEYAWLDSVEASEITYLSDGLQVKGYLVEPTGPGPFPSLVLNRGGNREFGALTPRVVALLMARIASWGYVVVGSQYRGNGGGEGQEEFGGADVNDVLNLIPLLEARPKADTNRMGIYGGSRGGMMTYLALARSDRFKAAVIRAGLSDLFRTRQDRPEMDSLFVELIPGYDFKNEKPIADRSAVRWADRLPKTTPILLLQGTADWRTDPHESLDMSRALLEAGHPFRLLLLEGGDHALSEHRPEMYYQIRSWFDRYVKLGEPLPNLVPHRE